VSEALIKAGDRRLTTRGMCSLDLRDISEQARSIISQAEADGRRIVEEARLKANREGEHLRQTATRWGYQEGLARGREEGQAQGLSEARAKFAEQQAVLARTLSEALRAFEARREEFLAAARRDAIVLAIAIAQRVIGRIEQIEPEPGAAAVASCAEALELIGQATQVEIRVHPADARAIESLCESVRDATKEARSIRIVEDEAVDRGGVMVRAAETEVDGAVASRLERIADELVSEWRDRQKRLSIEA